MTSKKILSVILSTLFVFVSAISVSAADVTAVISDPVVDVFTVTVDVTTEAEGKMTAMLTDEARTILAGIAEQTEYTESGNGKNVYTFTFTMLEAHATGTYVVTVGNNVAKISKPFEFVNVGEIANFYNELDETVMTRDEDDKVTNDDIYDLMTGDDSKLTYDLTEYKALTDDVRLMVSEVIEATDLAVADDYSNVEEVQTRFTETMDDTMMLAKIADEATKEDAWDAVAEQAIEEGIVDGTYYEEVSAGAVKKYYISESKGAVSIDAETVAEYFDKASILAVAEELDYLSLEEAIAYYIEKETVSVDADNYEAIYEEEIEGDVFKALKREKETNVSVEALETNLDRIMEEELENAAEEEERKPNSRPSDNVASRPSGNGGTKLSGDATGDVIEEEPTYNTDFSDIGEAEWAKVAIEGLASKGIVSGRGDDKFYPNDVMTREEFVKLIVTAFDANDEDATASFADVAEDRWSYGVIASAARLGLVTGVDEGSFNPTGEITREDMAVIMYRLYDLVGLSDTSAELDFTDENAISGYAKTAVAELAGRKVINGMGDGSFAPKGIVTRAQAAKVVYELLALIGGVN